MEKISKYRSELMGLAILWVIFFHTKIEISKLLYPLIFLKNIGYVGVDLFFLLSGIGLSFSWFKDSKIFSFYKKRIIRVIPTYWLFLFLINGVNIINGTLTLPDFLLKLFGLDFFLYGNLETWFIPCIIVCYLAFPLIIKLMIKWGEKKSLFLTSLFFLILSFSLKSSSFDYLLIFLIRFPVFILGVYVGYLLVQKKREFWLENIYVNWFIFTVSSFLLLWILLNIKNRQILWETGLNLYPTIFMALPICIVVTDLLDKYSQQTRSICYITNYFGQYSLELYLIHYIVFAWEGKLPLKSLSLNFARIPEYLIYILISLFLSILLKKIVNNSLLLITNK